MVDSVRHQQYVRESSSLELLTFPNFKKRVQINHHSHFHSHKWELPLDVFIQVMLSLPEKEAEDLFRVEKENPCVRIRKILPIPEWIELENRLVKTDEKSIVFYAKRAKNWDWKTFWYRKWLSKLVVNAKPTKATHITVVFESYKRPKSWEIIFKLITAFPSWGEFSPPEVWDTDRIREFWIDYKDACAFWDNHALCVKKWEFDLASLQYNWDVNDLVRRILEWSWKLQSET